MLSSQFLSLGKRVRQPELMDDPQLDFHRHRRALNGLARLNWASQSASVLWPPMAHLAKIKPLRVLDLASGGGDICLAIWRKAQRAGLPVEIDGCDISPNAVAIANQRCKKAGAKIGFIQCDLLRDSWPSGYDVVICSLFLHHLSETQVVEVLRQCRQTARHLVLISDLIRCSTGLLLARLASRLLTRSEIVRIDGPRSVRAALTRAEVAELAARAELNGATIHNCWPCRFLLKWQQANS